MMLRELLHDYNDTWTMEGIIDKVRKLEKCTVIVNEFAPYSANSIYRCGGNTHGCTRGRSDRGGRGHGANFNTPPQKLLSILHEGWPFSYSKGMTNELQEINAYNINLVKDDVWPNQKWPKEFRLMCGVRGYPCRHSYTSITITVPPNGGAYERGGIDPKQHTESKAGTTALESSSRQRIARPN